MLFGEIVTRHRGKGLHEQAILPISLAYAGKILDIEKFLYIMIMLNLFHVAHIESFVFYYGRFLGSGIKGNESSLPEDHFPLSFQVTRQGVHGLTPPMFDTATRRHGGCCLIYGFPLHPQSMTPSGRVQPTDGAVGGQSPVEQGS